MDQFMVPNSSGNDEMDDSPSLLIPEDQELTPELLQLIESASASSSSPNSALFSSTSSPAGPISAELGSSPVHMESKKRRRTNEQETDEMQWKPYKQVGWSTVITTDDQFLDSKVHIQASFSSAIAKSEDEDALLHYRRNMCKVDYKVSMDLKRLLSKGLFTVRDNCLVPLQYLTVEIGAVSSFSTVTGGEEKIVAIGAKRGEAKALFMSHPLAEEADNTSTLKFYFLSSTANNGQRHRTCQDSDPLKRQEYFYVVVNLVGFDFSGDRYLLRSTMSPGLIVRGGNPAAYETTSTSKASQASGRKSVASSLWNEGKGMSGKPTVTTRSNVGINCDSPQEALTVHGNIQMTGNLLKPSDRRIKSNIQEKDTKQALHNLRRIKVYDYDRADLETGELHHEPGVIAQELEEVLPDAVEHIGDIQVKGKGTVKDFRVVNERSLMMETVAATQQLDSHVSNIETRVQVLEDASSSDEEDDDEWMIRPTKTNASEGFWFRMNKPMACVAVTAILAVTLILAICLGVYFLPRGDQRRRREEIRPMPLPVSAGTRGPGNEAALSIDITLQSMSLRTLALSVAHMSVSDRTSCRETGDGLYCDLIAPVDPTSLPRSGLSANMFIGDGFSNPPTGPLEVVQEVGGDFCIRDDPLRCRVLFRVQDDRILSRLQTSEQVVIGYPCTAIQRPECVRGSQLYSLENVHTDDLYCPISLHTPCTGVFVPQHAMVNIVDPATPDKQGGTRPQVPPTGNNNQPNDVQRDSPFAQTGPMVSPVQPPVGGGNGDAQQHAPASNLAQQTLESRPADGETVQPRPLPTSGAEQPNFQQSFQYPPVGADNVQQTQPLPTSGSNFQYGPAAADNK